MILSCLLVLSCLFALFLEAELVPALRLSMAASFVKARVSRWRRALKPLVQVILVLQILL